MAVQDPDVSKQDVFQSVCVCVISVQCVSVCV